MSVIDIKVWKQKRMTQQKNPTQVEREMELLKRLDVILQELITIGPYKGVMAFFPLNDDDQDAAYFAGGDISSLHPQRIALTVAKLKEQAPTAYGD